MGRRMGSICALVFAKKLITLLNQIKEMHNLYLNKDNPKISDSYFHINSRRYLGNKTNFIPLIEQVIKEQDLRFNNVMELFMGTGVLSFYFASQGKKIIANDLLPLNFVMAKGFMESHKKVPSKIIANFLKKISSLENCFEKKITEKYQDKFIPSELSCEVDKAVDVLRKTNSFSNQEKYYLATILIMAVEQASNVDSDYLDLEKGDAKTKKEIKLKPLKIIKSNKASVFNEDARDLVKKKKSDLIIVDPPFDRSDYSNYMEYPEVIIEHAFPELKTPSESVFCDAKKAGKEFGQMIADMQCKYLMLFYSDDGIVSRGEMEKYAKGVFNQVKIYNIIRKQGLHLVRNEPKTDYMILAKNKKINSVSIKI